MAGTNKKLAAAVGSYFTDLGGIRGTGRATRNLSHHPALGNLLNAVGAALKSKVFCIGDLAALLDPDIWVHGVTQAPPQPGIAAIAVPATAGGRNMAGEAFWRNVPAAISSQRLGSYQVLKKWLSYRERDTLGRLLRPEEVQHFSETARRIGAILLLTRCASPTSAQPIKS